MPQSARTPLTAKKRAQLTEHPRPGGTPELGASGLVGFCFTPARHSLTAQQCVQATQVLRRLESTRPIREGGARGNARRALRIAGIVSSVKGGRIGASGWGRRMLATKGGNTLRDHALAHLRQWSPIASLAAMAARERRLAAQYFEEHGEPLPVHVSPKETREQQHRRTIQEVWEAQQWQQHGEFLRW